MFKHKGRGRMRKHVRRCWPVPVLAAFGLVVAVLMASASTAAPQAIKFYRTQLSTRDRYAAYPDIATGSNGLVAVVWTEGPDAIGKHNGPLKLAWVDNSSTQWKTVTVDGNQVFDAAVAVSGATVHVVWSQPKNALRYTTCSPPNYSCYPAELVATAPEEALQVDIALDSAGRPYVVWVEDDNKVHFTRKPASAWLSDEVVFASGYVQEGPAIIHANGFVHIVWTEWFNTTDSMVRYRRWNTSPGSWSQPATLSYWPTGEYRARNLSIAADGASVYVVWDMLSIDDKAPVVGWRERYYAIGYRHSEDNGTNWRSARTYPAGLENGSKTSGALVFQSGEGETWVEYVQYLRPHISLAMSGTLMVPVMSWHARVPSGGIEPGFAQAAAGNPHKVYWTYATQPGSDGQGYMFWATVQGNPVSSTLSTDVWGDVDMTVDSATARLAPVGDLNEILDGESPGNHLHAVYHEGTSDSFWDALYISNTHPEERHDAYLPFILKNASAGSGEG